LNGGRGIVISEASADVAELDKPLIHLVRPSLTGEQGSPLLIDAEEDGRPGVARIHQRAPPERAIGSDRDPGVVRHQE
jgi:hypothetical protein